MSKKKIIPGKFRQQLSIDQLNNEKQNVKFDSQMETTVVKKKKRRKPKIKLSKNKDEIDKLLESMNQQKKFVRMVDYSVTCLCKLAVDDVSAEEIVESGAIETLLEVLKANPGNEKVQRLLNKLIETLSRNDRLAKMIADRMNGNFKAVVEPLDTAKEIETVYSSVGAIASLVPAKAAKEGFLRCGVLASLGGVVARHNDDAQIVTHVAGILAQYGPDVNCSLDILKNKTAEFVIHYLAEHPENLALAQNAVAMVAQMASCRNDDVIEALRSMGAVEAIVAAVQFHSHDEDLMLSATHAFELLTGANDVTNAIYAISGDVAMDMKTASAMSTLSSLLLSKENVDTFFKTDGGVKALLAVLNMSLTAKEAELANKILTNACRAVARACCQNEKNIYALMKGGAVKMLIAGINTHLDDPEVCEAAISALAQMLTRAPNAMYIAKNGGLEAMMNALRKYPDDPQIAAASVALMAGFAQYPESAAKLLDLGGISVLMDILDKHSSVAPVVLGAINTLGMLGTSKENVLAMVENGLLEKLVKAMNDHPTDIGILTAAMMGMEMAGLIPENCERLRELGAMTCIQNAMSRFTDNPEIQRVGQRALNMLLHHEEMLEAERMEAERVRLAQERQREQEALELEMLEAERARLEAEKARMEAERLRLEEEERERQRLEELEMLDALEAMRLQEEKDQFAALERLKQEDEENERQEAERRRRKKKKKKEKQERKEREKLRMASSRKKPEKIQQQDSDRMHLMGLLERSANTQSQSVKPLQRAKLTHDARAIFAADPDEDDTKMVTELDPDIKDFLMTGALLIKHSKTAKPRKRHIYLSSDIKSLIWKEPGKLEVDMAHSMEIQQIFCVEKGRVTKQLQRKKKGKYLAAEECCFSISGAAGVKGRQKRNDHYQGTDSSERTVDLECSSAGELKRWVEAIEHLIEYAKYLKLYGGSTIQMIENQMIEDDDNDGLVE